MEFRDRETEGVDGFVLRSCLGLIAYLRRVQVVRDRSHLMLRAGFARRAGRVEEIESFERRSARHDGVLDPLLRHGGDRYVVNLNLALFHLPAETTRR